MSGSSESEGFEGSSEEQRNTGVLSEVESSSALVAGPVRKAFSPFETTRLLSLVEQYKKILENKKTDFGHTEKKRKTWEQLKTDFNSSPNVQQRSVLQLQNRWRNLKSRAKKDVQFFNSYFCSII
jgi:hypothetical protein